MSQRSTRREEWDIDAALRILQASIDPYIWDQGQELYRRGAVKDFAMSQDGNIRVIVLDPRDARNFFVSVRREHDGRIVSHCACPYRLNGRCRHQVVALEYLRAIAGGEAQPTSAAAADAAVESPRVSGGDVSDAAGKAGPVLYRLFDPPCDVVTAEDGSLLRLVLLSLGSATTAHRVALQLFTTTGWGEVRTPELDRWIGRGDVGPHPRDLALRSTLAGDGGIRNDVDSETFGYLLTVVAESSALVDRSGNVLAVSRDPWRLRTDVERSGETSIRVRFSCVFPGRESRRFEEVALVPSTSAWIQLDSGAFHPLIAAVPGPLLAEVQVEELSEIAPPELDQFLISGVHQLERLTPGMFFIEPGLIREVEGVDSARVRLSAIGDESSGGFAGQLEFLYGDEWVEAPSDPTPWTIDQGGKIHRYPAAGQSLAKARRELENVGFRHADGEWRLEGEDALERVLSQAPDSFVSFDLPQEAAARDFVSRAPRVRVAVETTDENADGTPQLRLSLELFDGDRRLSFSTAEFAELTPAGRRGFFRLEDESIVDPRHPGVRDLIELLAAAHRSGSEPSLEDGRLCLSAPASAVALIADASDEVDLELSPRVARLCERLSGHRLDGSEEIDASGFQDSVVKTLREYQLAAVAWFGALAEWGLAGVLADEMGLGKTLMTLAHFFGRTTAGARSGEAAEPGHAALPVLVVCPTSLVFNWLDETQRFFPEVRTTSLQGLPREKREALLGSDTDMIVTSYALMRRDREALEALQFRAVVLDEAQHVKNAASQTAKAAFALRAQQRWALTGTPMENHLGEIWSIFRFLLPGFLGTQDEFVKEYREPAERGDDTAVTQLRRRVRPFILRRTKTEVLTDLPELIEQTRRVPLSPLQRQLYDAELAAAREVVEGAEGPQARIKVLAALTRLRQICCDPGLILDDEDLATLRTTEETVVSSKMELLLELLEECIDEQHRVLLFSQFTSMLDLIELRLDERSVDRCRLDGATRDREAQVRRFQGDGAVPIFLISLKAGGYGLNLTAADIVILFDPWWNPATEAQAVARAHRMGQMMPVHVHKLVAADTVEERIQELQETKRDLASRLLETGEDPFAQLNLDTLRELFA